MTPATREIVSMNQKHTANIIGLSLAVELVVVLGLGAILLALWVH